MQKLLEVLRACKPHAVSADDGPKHHPSAPPVSSARGMVPASLRPWLGAAREPA
jgi:hypothetical protein